MSHPLPNELLTVMSEWPVFKTTLLLLSIKAFLGE